MTAMTSSEHDIEPGHLVVFSHPGAEESQAVRPETHLVPLPRFQAPKPAGRG
jgi:hypothetical protein